MRRHHELEGGEMVEGSVGIGRRVVEVDGQRVARKSFPNQSATDGDLRDCKGVA